MPSIRTYFRYGKEQNLNALWNTSDLTMSFHQCRTIPVFCTSNPKYSLHPHSTTVFQAPRPWSLEWPAPVLLRENCLTGLACGNSSHFQKRFEERKTIERTTDHWLLTKLTREVWTKRNKGRKKWIRIKENTKGWRKKYKRTGTYVKLVRCWPKAGF